jgi:hypothetical protein
MLMDETGGLIKDERPLRGALSRKRPSRYGDLALPYVVAISEEPFDGDAWHRQNVLFGHEAVEYGRVGRCAQYAWRTVHGENPVRSPDTAGWRLFFLQAT